jgi:hypothetical protein
VAMPERGTTQTTEALAMGFAMRWFATRPGQRDMARLIKMFLEFAVAVQHARGERV